MGTAANSFVGNPQIEIFLAAGDISPSENGRGMGGEEVLRGRETIGARWWPEIFLRVYLISFKFLFKFTQYETVFFFSFFFFSKNIDSIQRNNNIFRRARDWRPRAGY